MHMLYNSDSYVVVQFDMAAPGESEQGGYEIVDKFARKEIFLQGAMAESFKEGVEALIAGEPTESEVDDFLERFTTLMHQPVTLH